MTFQICCQIEKCIEEVEETEKLGIEKLYF